ncbi:hypothetical protein [Sphingobacterium kyonggiense]
MQGINAIKHAELIRLIQEVEAVYIEHDVKDDLEKLKLQHHHVLELFQEYQRTLIRIEDLIQQYQNCAHNIRKNCVSQPIRKLRLDQHDPEQHRKLIQGINASSMK